MLNILYSIAGLLGKKISELRLKTANKTDERVRLMNEIILGIRVIKMYTWEKPFAKLIEYARKLVYNIFISTLFNYLFNPIVIIGRKCNRLEDQSTLEPF